MVMELDLEEEVEEAMVDYHRLQHSPLVLTIILIAILLDITEQLVDIW
jgi:hypothetical protein